MRPSAQIETSKYKQQNLQKQRPRGTSAKLLVKLQSVFSVGARSERGQWEWEWTGRGRAALEKMSTGGKKRGVRAAQQQHLETFSTLRELNAAQFGSVEPGAAWCSPVQPGAAQFNSMNADVARGSPE